MVIYYVIDKKTGCQFVGGDFLTHTVLKIIAY